MERAEVVGRHIPSLVKIAHRIQLQWLSVSTGTSVDGIGVNHIRPRFPHTFYSVIIKATIIIPICARVCGGLDNQ